LSTIGILYTPLRKKDLCSLLVRLHFAHYWHIFAILTNINVIGKFGIWKTSLIFLYKTLHSQLMLLTEKAHELLSEQIQLSTRDGDELFQGVKKLTALSSHLRYQREWSTELILSHPGRS